MLLDFIALIAIYLLKILYNENFILYHSLHSSKTPLNTLGKKYDIIYKGI